MHTGKGRIYYLHHQPGKCKMGPILYLRLLANGYNQSWAWCFPSLLSIMWARSIQQNQGDWEKLHVISKLQLENEACNGDAFWLWNMSEQWAFVHDLQIQEVREKNKTKQNNLLKVYAARWNPSARICAIQSLMGNYCSQMHTNIIS